MLLECCKLNEVSLQNKGWHQIANAQHLARLNVRWAERSGGMTLPRAVPGFTDFVTDSP
jgi:hypothetical protein